MKVPSLPRPCLRGGGGPGVSNDLCISPKTSGPTKKASCATEVTRDGFLSDCSISLTTKTNY